MAKRYVEQWERAQRFMQRLEDVYSGINHTHHSENYVDDMHSFFMHCYHLKDWIKNDPYCAQWSQVETFIQNDSYLPICADLCNSLKHLKLTKSRSNQNPQFGGSAIKLNISEAPQATVQIAVSYSVDTKTLGNIDVLQLAKNCMQSWVNFIAANDPCDC